MPTTGTVKMTASRRTAAGSPTLGPATPARTHAGMVWRRFGRNRAAVAGWVFVLVIIALSLAADLLSEHVTGYSAEDQDIAARFQPVGSPGHLLGSDDLGRDTATRLLYGSRVSLTIAGIATGAALVIGLGVGIASGYFGGWADGFLMRFVDVVLSIPSLFLLLLVASLWRLETMTLALVIAAVAWGTLARLIRGEVLSLAQREYVQAAVAAGASHWRVISRHVLPNVTSVIIVWASVAVPSLILTEATLSYLGLGIQPPQPSWGNMLSNSQRIWGHSAALVLLPGLVIYLTVFAINLVGTGLRDALDPRLSDWRQTARR